MFDLAQQSIIERFKRPLFAGSLKNPTLVGDGFNASCGDEVHLEVILENNRFKKIRHQTRACSVCTAAADMLAENLEGEAVEKLAKLTPQSMQEWIAIPLSPIRLKCALLPLETLKQAQVES